MLSETALSAKNCHVWN